MIDKNYPIFKSYSGADIRRIRKGYRETRHQFCRRFCCSFETIKHYETDRGLISGAASVIMQQLEDKLTAVEDVKRKAIETFNRGK